MPRPSQLREEALQVPTLAQAARRATTVLNKDQRRQAAQTLVALAGSVESGPADGLESWRSSVMMGSSGQVIGDLDRCS